MSRALKCCCCGQYGRTVITREVQLCEMKPLFELEIFVLGEGVVYLALLFSSTSVCPLSHYTYIFIHTSLLSISEGTELFMKRFVVCIQMRLMFNYEGGEKHYEVVLKSR